MTRIWSARVHRAGSIPSAPSRISPTDTSVSGTDLSDLLITPIVIAPVAKIDAAPLVDEPTIDSSVPGVCMVALVVLGFGGRNELWLIELRTPSRPRSHTPPIRHLLK